MPPDHYLYQIFNICNKQLAATITLWRSCRWLVCLSVPYSSVNAEVLCGRPVVRASRDPPILLLFFYLEFFFSRYIVRVTCRRCSWPMTQQPYCGGSRDTAWRSPDLVPGPGSITVVPCTKIGVELCWAREFSLPPSLTALSLSTNGQCPVSVLRSDLRFDCEKEGLSLVVRCALKGRGIMWLISVSFSFSFFFFLPSLTINLMLTLTGFLNSTPNPHYPPLSQWILFGSHTAFCSVPTTMSPYRPSSYLENKFLNKQLSLVLSLIVSLVLRLSSEVKSSQDCDWKKSAWRKYNIGWKKIDKQHQTDWELWHVTALALWTSGTGSVTSDLTPSE